MSPGDVYGKTYIILVMHYGLGAPAPARRAVFSRLPLAPTKGHLGMPSTTAQHTARTPRERNNSEVCSDVFHHSMSDAHVTMRLDNVSVFGWHYLSNATCLIRPRLFYACFGVSRITIRCFIIRHV